MRWCVNLYRIILLISLAKCTNSFGEPCVSWVSAPRPYVTDCSRYYQCLYGKWRLQQCRSGLLFDSAKGECVYSRYARCFAPKSGGFRKTNLNYVDGHNIHWSLDPNQPQQRSARGTISKTKVSWVTHSVNGVPQRTVFTVYHTDEPSFTFTKEGDVPQVPDVIQWVRENANKYEKTYIPYEEDGTTAAFIPPTQPTQPTTTTLRPTRPPYTTTTTRRPSRPPPPPAKPPPVEDTEEDIGGGDLDDILPSRCGIIQKPSAIEYKITKGKITTIEKNPWQVALLDESRKSHLCGGSIITTKHVLTAAHCFYNRDNLSWRKPGDMVVRIGDNDKQIQDTNEADLYIYEMYRHTKYSMDHRRNDIALIILKEEMTFSRQVFPICIPDNSIETRYDPGRECTISGWGDTKEKGDETRYLRSAEVPLVEQEKCKNIFPQNISKGMVCAGDLINGGVDTCQGDSGGPLACKDNAHYFLYGITSWGVGCGDVNKPGVYTRVSEYRNWIIQKIEISSWKPQ